MADTMDALKNILGDDAEDKIKTVMDSLSGGNSSMPAVNTDSISEIMQLKGIMEHLTNNRNDPRTNLLMSLKPYMRSERQRSIDSAVRLLGIANVVKMLKK